MVSGNKAELTLDVIYPVGSIYMSINSTNPAALFGGTWEQIQNTFLLAAGTGYTAGTTGGEASHTLTVSEMPSHGHIFSPLNSPMVDSGKNDDGWGIKFSQGTGWRAEIGSMGYSGGSAAHNNMPPYLAVYMWKRTA